MDQIDTELIADGQLTFVTTEKLEAAIQIGMQQLQLKHNALADWLRYYLLNDTQLPLLDTWKSYYKPLADVQLARLKVCQEMWAEPELQLHFSSPAHLWAEWLLSETLVVTNPLFQGENLCGLNRKTDWQKQARDSLSKITNQFWNLSLAEHQANKTTLLTQIPHLRPLQLACYLEMLAATLARLNKTFDKSHKHYRKEISELHTAVKYSEFMQLNYFCNDEIHVSGKSKQVSGSRNRKKIKKCK